MTHNTDVPRDVLCEFTEFFLIMTLKDYLIYKNPHFSIWLQEYLSIINQVHDILIIVS